MVGKLRAVIFDVDGTLADTEKDGHLEACNEAFARMGFDIRWSWEEFKELLKIPGNANRMRLALSTRTSLSEAEIDRIVPELFALKKEIYLGKGSGEKNAALYTRCVMTLGCDPGEVLVIEDSEKGFKAAKGAGLRCAVVYNDYTKGQDFSGAELVVRSLEFLDLDLLEKLRLN